MYARPRRLPLAVALAFTFSGAMAAGDGSARILEGGGVGLAHGAEARPVAESSVAARSVAASSLGAGRESTVARPATTVPSASAVGPATGSAPIATAFDPTNVSLGLQLVKGRFQNPLLVTNAGDGTNRLFVVEQAGVIRIISNGTLLATPFLDLRGKITSGGERGLLGLAFDPSYPTIPYFYVNFTNLNGNTTIARYRVSSNPNVALRSSGLAILYIAQPYPNHNGGNLAFGPDGYLWIGMGDGGSAGDPQNRAQNLNSLLGKMLRIDVHHHTATSNYRVPASNPYVGRFGDDRIWSRGLRNPWRWSFDRVTRKLWIADVGQSRWEEVDRNSPSATTSAGRAANYGWPVLEGRACFKPPSGCSASGKQPPLLVYAHAVSGTDNCSVTGGFVYRGAAYPVLYGGYVFGDFCSGRIWVVSAGAYTPAVPTLVHSDAASPRLAISSFGEDEHGELYVCDLAGGGVYRVTAVAKP